MHFFNPEDNHMRYSVLVSAMVFGLALPVSAQAKISGTLNCAKPDVNSSAEVPDAAGHMVMLSKANCSWSSPLVIAGSKTTTAVDVGLSEAHGASAMGHGYSVSSTDNGDKVTASYQGAVKMNQDGSSTFKGTWKFTSGTGALEGIKGSGTYTGTGAADGTAVGDIQGHYTLARGKAKGRK
jgi:hypothetical protein